MNETVSPQKCDALQDVAVDGSSTPACRATDIDMNGIGVGDDREFYSNIGQLLGGRDPLLDGGFRVHG